MKEKIIKVIPVFNDKKIGLNADLTYDKEKGIVNHGYLMLTIKGSIFESDESKIISLMDYLYETNVKKNQIKLVAKSCKEDKQKNAKRKYYVCLLPDNTIAEKRFFKHSVAKIPKLLDDEDRKVLLKVSAFISNKSSKIKIIKHNI